MVPLLLLATLTTGPSVARRTPLVLAVERARAAVVNINAQEVVRAPAADDPWSLFFRGGRGRDQVRTSLGSGFVFDERGFVLTNYHVVARGSRIQVGFEDGSDYTARVVGTDPGGDLAVLKIQGEKKFPAAPLGSSADLLLGEPTIAIGNPFGLNQSVSMGVVSALHRPVHAEGRSYYDFIQTDASINPGNSGGALVNLRGELVGVNSAILSRSGGNIGIGFAIPVNMVKGVMDQLIKYGQVKRGVLGVNIYNVTPDIAKEFGLTESSGALVAGVAPGSAADRAGVKTGDIITSINGANMRDAGELRNTIGMLRVGDKVDIGLLRDGKSRKVTALIAERSELETANAVDINKGLEGAELGDAPDGGVLVKTVQEGSPAAQNGLRGNDLIVGVGRTRVTNTKSFKAAAKNANVLVLNVRRGTAVQLIQIR